MIQKPFHMNMEWHSSDDKNFSHELTIKIPPGQLSTGRAYSYFMPTYSIKDGDKWLYQDEIEENEAIKAEVAKTRDDLKWIVSMPIPLSLTPYRISCGVLNIDCFGPEIEENNLHHELTELIKDIAAAASLIGVMQRSTGFLNGHMKIAEPPPKELPENLKKFAESGSAFDPSNVAPPSEAFVQLLSEIDGFEVFGETTPRNVSAFLKSQLTLSA